MPLRSIPAPKNGRRSSRRLSLTRCHEEVLMSIRLAISAIFAAAAGSLAAGPAFSGEFAVPGAAFADGHVAIVLAGGMSGGGGGMSGGGGGMSGGGGGGSGGGSGGGGGRNERWWRRNGRWRNVSAARSATLLNPQVDRRLPAGRPTATAINALHPSEIAHLLRPPGCGRVRCAVAPIAPATAARPVAASNNLPELRQRSPALASELVTEQN